MSLNTSEKRIASSEEGKARPPRSSLLATSLACLALGSCGHILPPPGGPSDKAPPRLLATVPESLSVRPQWRGEVEFRFDEVVSEGGSPNFGLGTGELEKLVVVSPSNRVPDVHWRRDRITVKPRGGWRPNTVYRIELRPGVADLAGNRSTTGRIVTFTTGAPLPVRTLTGTVVEWSTAQPKAQAAVEAVLLPDSLVYRGITDSTGRFSLGPLPPGEYLVYGILDQNNNVRMDRGEAFDSVRLAAQRDSVGEIWAFKHDSTAVRVGTTVSSDSVSLVVTFTQQLDPYQVLPADSAEVRLLPDSVPVKVVALLPRERYDSVFARRAPEILRTAADSALARARADSLRADSLRADSVQRAREAAALRIPGAERRGPARRDTTRLIHLKTKPPLFDNLVIRTAQALKPGSSYFVAVHGLRSVSGVAGTAVGGVKIPVPPPPVDSTKAKADSLKPKRDTVPRKKP